MKFKKDRTFVTFKNFETFTEKVRSLLLSNIHGYLYKIYIISEVVGNDIFPTCEKIMKLIASFKELWPYKFPDGLKIDFMNKVNSIFKKKFVGEDK